MFQGGGAAIPATMKHEVYSDGADTSPEPPQSVAPKLVVLKTSDRDESSPLPKDSNSNDVVS